MASVRAYGMNGGNISGSIAGALSTARTRSTEKGIASVRPLFLEMKKIGDEQNPAASAGGSCSLAGFEPPGGVRRKRKCISWLDAYAYNNQMMFVWRNVQLMIPICKSGSA